MIQKGKKRREKLVIVALVDQKHDKYVWPSMRVEVKSYSLFYFGESCEYACQKLCPWVLLIMCDRVTNIHNSAIYIYKRF